MFGRKSFFTNWVPLFMLLISLACSTVCPLATEATIIAPENSKELIAQEFVTYKGSSQYNGTTVASHISADDFANLEIMDDGGTHIDGEGSSVFSNYVIFKINLMFDSSSKRIGNTGVKVAKDSCDWNDMDKANNYKYGDPSTDTEQYIAYGAVSAIRINGDGSASKYTPMFSKGNTAISEQIFNVDGDYSIYVFFQTQKGNEIQKHILAWSFRVRTEIYLLDEETRFAIKDGGISNHNVIIDYANRDATLSQIDQTVQVKCTCDGSPYTVEDGDILKAQAGTSNRYHFEVMANGFVAEVFDFVIDTQKLQENLFFGNLRRRLNDIIEETGDENAETKSIPHYEAEKFFYVTWSENANNPISVEIQYYDIEAPVVYDEQGAPLPAQLIVEEYSANQEIDKVGSYKVHAKSRTLDFTCWVDVVAEDNPSYNYGILSANRFNNFKTKWYQVYDYINDRYLCFDMSEWQRAYDAAMTIENSTVEGSTGSYAYKGKYYNNSIDVTAAMNDYVFSQNLKTIYYDPNDFSDSDESLRTFSSAAFDGTIYLNDEFQFVKQHGAEVESVVAIDKNGERYDIQFFVPIAKQEKAIPHGEYTIIETDKYGNETRYTVYRDKEAPRVTLNLNGSKTSIEPGQPLNAKGSFAVFDIYDEFDPFSVLRVVLPNGAVKYYYQDEYKGIAFVEKGQYSIMSYDRNNNIINFSVTVE